MDFRPHKIIVVNLVEGGKDEDGIPLPSHEEETELKCRIVPNGSPSQVVYVDGVAKNFSFTVYLDRDCMSIKEGQHVRLHDFDGRVHNGKHFEVVAFHRYQLNARLWVS